ncbi:MAG TPA: glucose-6-phosphate dehydrogenase [Thermomicrobiales bacterium]|nr:glucose-6-phosphate dehydrogenase [Thermomicrobiales bacterium]
MRTNDATTERPGDVLVIFGITGDLARVMTFRSLYRLEQRGLLDCPIVGVAGRDWSAARLVDHARDCLVGAGEPLNEKVFARLAARFDYVQGDLKEPATYERVARVVADAECPVFYLEIPPFLFGTVVEGLAEAGLTRRGRVVVEKPFGHDLASAQDLAGELHEYLDESQIYRIDHYLGKMGLEEILYLRFANTMLEPVWNRNYVACIQITLAEQFGVETRGRFYDPVGALRDVVVNHLMQLLAAATMEAPAAGNPETLRDAQTALFRSTLDANPSHYVRGQYNGYRLIDGVAHDSTTETYAALRLEIENWRWSGVPIFLRSSKRLPITQTEMRLVFKPSPRLGFGPQHASTEPDQIVVRLDPSTGVRVQLNAHRANQAGPGTVPFDVEFAQAGGEAPTPYEVLLHAALLGQHIRFTRQDTVEESWRVMQPLIDEPPPVHPYDPGSWGPGVADRLVSDVGGWQDPWT